MYLQGWPGNPVKETANFLSKFDSFCRCPEIHSGFLIIFSGVFSESVSFVEIAKITFETWLENILAFFVC